MKRNFSVLRNIVLISTFVVPFNLFAQDEIGELIKGTPADATKLINAYANPAFKGFGLGLNSGWTNSAKSIGAFRFDLRISATAAMSPTKDQSFNVNDLGLTSLRPANPSNTISPTVTGKDIEGPAMQVGNDPSTQFSLPQGLGFNYIPSPQVQLTVGLPKNIDIALRYSPSINLDENGKFDLFGIGAKVEVLPLIFGKTGKMLPFDLAVAGGYTKLKYQLPLDVNEGTNYTDQMIKTEFGGFSAEAIISKKLSIFTPFASLGYNTAQHKINVLGTYDFNGSIERDPIKIDEKSISALKATAGFQLRLAVLKLYGSYTLSEYSYINVGIGLGIGK